MTTAVDSKEEILEMIAREGYGMEQAEELWDAWIEFHGESYPPVNWTELADSIYGHYESVEDFAQDYVAMGSFTCDPNLANYVDWHAFGSDVMEQVGLYMSSKGWVIQV